MCGCLPHHPEAASQGEARRASVEGYEPGERLHTRHDDVSLLGGRQVVIGVGGSWGTLGTPMGSVPALGPCVRTKGVHLFPLFWPLVIVLAI
jgi:hypothetical protein